MKKAMLVSFLALAGCAGLKAGLHDAVTNTDVTVDHATAAWQAFTAILPDVLRIALGALKMLLPLLGI